MPKNNRITDRTECSDFIEKEINYWKKNITRRKCTEFSQMSYWEVVSTSNAL